ncbi:MAG: hypothetical protein BIFFINMI_02818 [Phycisphaerae bacterium]|nr:hypothetical protein [Phycisphaerae bacterium]
MSDRPFDITVVPAALRQLPQWVVWKVIVRDGKPTKCPMDAKTGGPADSTDPATWATFDQAMAAWQASSQYAGVGFVFTGEAGFCGVDLDDSIDPASGELKPWGRQIVDQLDSYTEVSPSGGGVKVFIRGRKPGNRCRKGYHDGEVEIYDTGRFFTVTGQRLDGVSADVEDRQGQLDALYVEVFGPPQAAAAAAPAPPPSATPPAPAEPATLTDDEILNLATGSKKNGAKFTALWAGRWNDYFNSASEADSSVIFTLAFYTKDPVQLDRLFRQSKLFRPKWDELHGEQTYGQATIAKALQLVTKQYQSKKRRRRAAAAGGPGASPPSPADVPAVALGTRDPVSGKLVLSTSRTLPTAEAFIREFRTHPDGRTMHSYAGLLMEWRGNRYVEVEDGTVKNLLQPWLHDSVHHVYNRSTHEQELLPFPANPTSINAALDSVRTLTHLPASMPLPSWLGDAAGRPDPRAVLSCRSLNLHIPTATTFPATPALFNINSLEFDYDPAAAVPAKWLAFLQELWPDDQQSIDLLQEWFGYCLTVDTSQQKMLLLLGPKRCGKGTIGRVLTRLVGAGNVAGPTTSSLAGPFGLQPLIGKSVAIVSDARFKGDDIAVVVERLLCISGEDTLTIDRKHVGSVTMKLPTRFMFLTNELPGASDASGALAGRFLVLRFTTSFYGREDIELTNKLLAELPGILLWALQGWQRLHARGRFVQPASVEDTIGDLEDLFSPVGAFVRERCLVGNGQSVEMNELFAAWRDYCQSIGRTHVGTIQTFGRDLRAVMPGLRVTQPRLAGVRMRWYEGISVAPEGAQGGAKW